MNPKRHNSKDPFFYPLGQAWEGAVADGLRRVSDDELLRLLAEVEARVDGPDDRCDTDFAEIPDWDDMTALELEAIAVGFEQQIPGFDPTRDLMEETCSSAVPVKAPVRQRHRPAPARLSFEELESRYAPSALTVMTYGRVAYLPSWSSRWTVADDHPAAASWLATTSAPVAVQGEVLDHVLLDFDAVDLGDLTLAQVA
jgi:hypothetical protein